MALQLSPELLFPFRQNMRVLVEQSRAHQLAVDNLLADAERDLRQFQTMVATAPELDTMTVRQLLTGHAKRAAAGVAKIGQLSLSARAQHHAACRALADLSDDDIDRATTPHAVLVVDDYPEVRALVGHVLEDAGFVVRTAANGLEGLIAAYEMRPTVVVMDVVMPVLDGIEATRLIKANAATRASRVIAHTSEISFDDAAVKGLFAAVLEKPASPAVVLATVTHFAQL